jgi:hypothetical protein
MNEQGQFAGGIGPHAIEQLHHFLLASAGIEREIAAQLKRFDARDGEVDRMNSDTSSAAGLLQTPKHLHQEMPFEQC